MNMNLHVHACTYKRASMSCTYKILTVATSTSSGGGEGGGEEARREDNRLLFGLPADIREMAPASTP